MAVFFFVVGLEAQASGGGAGQMDARWFATISYLRRALQEAKTPLQRFEHMLHPWVTFVIIPVFALFNAGISFDAHAFSRLAAPLPLGIAAGLALGKQAGVLLATFLLVRLGWAALPEGVRWVQLYGVCWLTGIGFTMSLFIGGLAFAGTALENEAKLGILLGSIVSGIGGYAILRATRERGPGPEKPA
jgi:NhaA family Na+:H+ antiporter